MADTLHTPGPWTVWRERQTGERVLLGGDNCALCDVHPCPQREANARLIAAAPELYALALRIAGDPRARYTYEDAAQTARALLVQIDGGRAA